jgi:23S rRNA pseudouridine2605 synthase
MSSMTDDPRPDAHEAELNETPETEIESPEAEDPIDAEAATEDEDAADAATEAEDEAENEVQDEAEEEPETEAGDEEDEKEEDEPEFKPKARPPAKLERLQKILAQAGVASRRKAEEMIEQGRVQVNGKTVTELGTKADQGRDHIRVDGKLLQGAERLRYFVLNKPRGFVTTVKDPEGRPTVMQFFDKMRERLYPVGRLDYLSEGLLLVTNDGDLANKLTKASAGVEKTYLVKVAGIPSESELDILRAGVAIEKGKPGSAKVRTSPARIRQVRQGDNPWYEVVLIEGRNRELRKMFEEIGHFVEKIRRVGYGPLILDQEPGNLRELDEQELALLRKTADGKLKTPKAKEIRRRNMVDSLPPEKPAFKPRGERPAAGPKDYKPKRAFGADAPARGRTAPRKFDAGPAKLGSDPSKFAAGRPTDRPASGPSDRTAERPAWKKDDRPAAGRTFGGKPAAGRTYGDRPAGRTSGPRPGGGTGAGKPYADRPAAGRSFPPKPAWKKQEATEWPPYKRPPADRPAAPRREATRRPAPEPMEDLGPKQPSRLRIEPVHETERPKSDRTRSDRPRLDRPGPDRPRTDRPRTDRPSQGRPPSGRPAFGRTGADRSPAGRPSSARPFRGEGGLARPYTTSSGKPRAGGARPSSKPGREGGRSYGPGAGRSSGSSSGAGRSSGPAKRPYTPRGEGAEGFKPRSEDARPERRTGSGWKPKPPFGGKSTAGAGSRPGPRPGGFSKSGPKGKPGGGRPGGGKSGGSKPGGSGVKRSGPRPGGKRPGGKRP